MLMQNKPLYARIVMSWTCEAFSARLGCAFRKKRLGFLKWANPQSRGNPSFRLYVKPAGVTRTTAERLAI